MASGLRAMPAEAYDRGRRSIEKDETPRAAFSIASEEGPARSLEDTIAEPAGLDPNVAWLRGLAGTARWITATRALDRVLWPARFEHIDGDELVFRTAAGEARADELGDGSAPSSFSLSSSSGS